MDVKKRRTQSIWSSIFLSLLLISILIACRDDNGTGLEYPGNGWPLLSSDIPIEALNQEFADWTASNANIGPSGESIHFEGLDDIAFMSSQMLTGSTLCLSIPLSVENGSLTVGIGTVEWVVEPHRIVVKSLGSEIVHSSRPELSEIIIEVFETSSSTRFMFGDKQSPRIIPVDIALPAVVRIAFADECTGTIGPWRWMRGYI